MSHNVEYILKAMAENYTRLHSWDNLDKETLLKAAEEIIKLRNEVEELEMHILELGEMD